MSYPRRWNLNWKVFRKGHSDPLRTSRLQIARNYLRSSGRRLARRVGLISSPSWNLNAPSTPDQLRDFGKWRFVKPRYWYAVTKYTLGRKLFNPYHQRVAMVSLLIAGICSPIVGISGYYFFKRSTQRQLASRHSEYEAFVANGNYEAAAGVLDQILEHKPSAPQYLYQRALVDDKLGQRERALRTIAELADKQFAPAAMWLLDQQFSLDSLPQWNPHQHMQFRKLAGVALRATAPHDQVRAKTWMANYFVRTGARSDALLYLKQLSKTDPACSLIAATLCSQMQAYADAKQFGKQAQAHFESQVTAAPQAVESRLNLARALILQGNEAEAIRSLSDGFQLTKDVKLRQAGAEAMVIWAERLGQASQSSDEILLQRLRLLQRASQCAPHDTTVGAAIIKLVLECKDNKQQQIHALRKATVAGLDPESVHFLRGTLAVLQGDVKTAQRHLALSAERGTQVPVTLNNLAMAILKDPEGNLQHALALSETALSQQSHPYFHETRGRILVKLDRYDEAITELEKGMVAEELKPIIYPNLALAYRQLGDEDTAKEYDAAILELANKTPK